MPSGEATTVAGVPVLVKAAVVFAAAWMGFANHNLRVGGHPERLRAAVCVTRNGVYFSCRARLDWPGRRVSVCIRLELDESFTLWGTIAHRVCSRPGPLA